MALPHRFGPLSTPVPLSYLDDNFDALEAQGGSEEIGFIQDGTGAVAETVQEELRKVVRASQFGGADLGVQITNAIAALPSTGGVVDCSDLRGAQTIPSKVTITKANVTLLFGAATFTLSGVAAVQSPFGAQFLVSAANVWFLSPGGTVFKLGAGAQADCIAFIHGATLGGAKGIEFDGNKANNISIVDDSFQSAIQIISDSGVGATVDSRITVENCTMHDFNHYGIVTYGNLSSGNIFKNNRIYSNGKADTNGTGDGIFINKGSGNNAVEGNYCYSNQRSGIRVCSVAVSASNNKIIGNWCYSNTVHGIYSSEELNLGSTSGTGQTGLLISKNHCYSNTKSGILVGTYDNVGFIKNGAIEGNFCYSNTEYGILLQSNAHATNNTRQVAILGNEVFSNTLDGIALGTGVLDTNIQGNTVVGNANQIVDGGTRTINVGNKTLITDGTFYVQGTGTFGGLITAAAGVTVTGSQLKYTGTLAAGTFAVQIAGAAGAARDIVLEGQGGFSNGRLTQFDGSNMKYTFSDITTTASAANAVLTAGVLQQSSSSLIFKTDVEPMLAEYANKVLDISAICYRSLAPNDRKDWSWYSFVAEHVAAVDPRFATWDYPLIGYEAVTVKGDGDEDITVQKPKYGTELVPYGINDRAILAGLVEVVKRQQAQIEELLS